MTNIKSIKVIGTAQTFDLEVDHQDHQFYLNNGVLTSNSHSIMYSMISYQTAYYKAHFPIEFLLANLMAEVKSNAPNSKANINKIKGEIRDRKVKIIQPDINTSDIVYSMLDEHTLMTGLDALKSVGDDAIKNIIENRPYSSFQDFMSKVSSTLVRANTIQALVASGALDSFGISRKNMFLYCSDYRKKLTSWKKKHDTETETFVYPWADDSEWSIQERYALEVNYLGEGFSCKPHKAYGTFFEGQSISVKKIKKSKDRDQIESIKGIVVDFRVFPVKKEGSKLYGRSMAKIMVEDINGDRLSCTVFPDGWEIMLNALSDRGISEFDVGLALHFGGSTNTYEDEVGIIINSLFDVAKPPSMPKDRKAKKVLVRSKKEKDDAKLDIMNADVLDPTLSEQLEDLLYEEGVLDLDD